MFGGFFGGNSGDNRTHVVTLLSHIRDSPNAEDQERALKGLAQLGRTSPLVNDF